MRVLLITKEPLRQDSNEGNVLISIFGRNPFELANIYCKPGVPDIDVCQGRYFQLTDRMALENVLHKKSMGRRVSLEQAGLENKNEGQKENKKFYDFFRTHNWEFFYLLRETIWQIADCRSDALFAFIDEFKPEVIFAPLSSNRYALRVQRIAIDYAKCPAATYFYDDIYSLRQLRFSPFFWINRFALRHALNKNIKKCDIIYTMSEQQATEFEKLIHRELSVLRKPAAPSVVHKVHEGIRLIYGGGTYFGRDMTLCWVANAVAKLRSRGENVTLDIYTNSPMKQDMYQKLNSEGCTVHSAIPYPQLMQEYAASDIALHVESFKKKVSLAIHLSFSTKIVDCLSSSCATLAICPDDNMGWKYLRDEGVAECISNVSDIEESVTRLVEDAQLRENYCTRAKKCVEEKHDAEKIAEGVFRDLERIAKIHDRESL